jgi:hypothetical protein
MAELEPGRHRRILLLYISSNDNSKRKKYTLIVHRIYQIAHRIYQIAHRIYQIAHRIYQIAHRIYQIAHRIYQIVVFIQNGHNLCIPTFSIPRPSKILNSGSMAIVFARDKKNAKKIALAYI